ncbi:MAG: hypothetical protein IT584_02110 [Chlamydiae bacterium]|nr:hypothetical protein [Chlamydiota bacterium]
MPDGNGLTLKVQTFFTDLELFELSQRGFIPGPGESEEQFCHRIDAAKVFFTNPPKELKAQDEIASPHWDWVRLHLKELYDFYPESLFAYYSNHKLAPWQGAASWIFDMGSGPLCAVQLRKGFSKGRYLKIYSRDEILAHEAVHAARCAFEEPIGEEFFAYFTSQTKWRRVLGPIIRRSWEVWLFLTSLIFGVFSGYYLPAALLAALAFCRLFNCHRLLRRASVALSNKGLSSKNVRAIFLRLTDEEIRKLSRGKSLEDDDSPRFRILRMYGLF